MSARIEQDDRHYSVYLEGEIGLGEACRVKELLLEAIASGKSAQLDLTAATSVDVAFLQLAEAASREGVKLRGPEAARATLRQAGWSGAWLR